MRKRGNEIMIDVVFKGFYVVREHTDIGLPAVYI